MKYDLKGYFYFIGGGYFSFRISDLIITYAYVLLNKFCPCFIIVFLIYQAIIKAKYRLVPLLFVALLIYNVYWTYKVFSKKKNVLLFFWFWTGLMCAKIVANCKGIGIIYFMLVWIIYTNMLWGYTDKQREYFPSTCFILFCIPITFNNSIKPWFYYINDPSVLVQLYQATRY